MAKSDRQLEIFDELYYRPNTHDLNTIRHARHSYSPFLNNLNRDDIVMDIGSHIGSFTRQANIRGVKKIIGYEPTPESFNIFSRNIRNYKNVVTKHGAVVNSWEYMIAEQNKGVAFFINRQKNQGLNSLKIKQGRIMIRVPAFCFTSEIENYKPTAIKMDIEGGEYDLILDWPKNHDVRIFVVEFHFGNRNFLETFPLAIENLKKRGLKEMFPLSQYTKMGAKEMFFSAE